jgi:hypothetical protein
LWAPLCCPQQTAGCVIFAAAMMQYRTTPALKMSQIRAHRQERA